MNDSFLFWKTVRRKLHTLAEIAGNELRTAQYIINFLREYHPDQLLTNIGGNSIIAVFDSGVAGKTIVLRADIDALPVNETINIPHHSLSPGISHKCGHDGHSTILLAVAQWLSQNIHLLTGRICVLFQAEEETGAGARAVIEDNRYIQLKPDYVFGLHNLPGFDQGSIILKKGVFACASTGIKFWFTGKTAHAGHPNAGINPLYAIQNLIRGLQNIPQNFAAPTPGCMITIVHVKIGEEAFGTSPGKGVVMATLRAENDEVLSCMIEMAFKLADTEAKKYKLLLTVDHVEDFAATINDEQAFDEIYKTALDNNYNFIWQQQPFPWSEDFSLYGTRSKSAFWGLGSGKNCPQLHDQKYDFPDNIIPAGSKFFIDLIKQIALR